MRITLGNDSPLKVECDLLVVGVSGKPANNPLLAQLDRALGKGSLTELIAEESFAGKSKQQLEVRGRGRLKAKRVLLLGIGDKPLTAGRARALAVRAARAGQSKDSLALVLAGLDEAVTEAVAEGLASGVYRYTRYLTGDRRPKKELKKALILSEAKPTAALKRAIERGVAVAGAVNLCRDLVNEPPNSLTATKLGDVAAHEAKEAGIACKIFDKKAVEALGMQLLMAVNRGSKEEPRLIHVSYKPEVQGAPRVVFVGKGVTFDSGGLCIKPAAGMMDMKNDMAGAAVTIAIVLAAARLKLPVEVHGVVASTDNMIGPDAYRPGDVYGSLDGKTVEIVNTDAEGRLILADALAYAVKLEPTHLIDHATLTGACITALGAYTAGLFTGDDELHTKYAAAAHATGESYWRLPLDEDLKEDLKSPIADLRHTGGRSGGAIVAALFLKEFVGKTSWMHIDIAGPAFLPRPHRIYPRGATGFGVITGLEFLKSLA